MNSEPIAMKRLSSPSVKQMRSSDAPAAAATTSDEKTLAYFGKQQRFKRNFGISSTVGLTCTLMITWEGVLVSFIGGFENGGPTGLVGQYFFVWIGVLAQALVMAELGSMIPLSGGQYNWVAILSPPSISKFLSYCTGWITLIAWQAATATATYLCATMIQGLVVLNHPDYNPTRWQATLMVYATIAIALLFNTYLARLLPSLESLILVIHVLGFFAILIPLVYLGPRGTTASVFNDFLNLGEWSTNGVSFFVGSATMMLAFVGVDGAAHMAEEIENADVVLPRSMLITVLLNGCLGFGMLIATLFCLGDIETDLSTPTGFPFIQIFYGATNSASAATGMTCIFIIITIFAIIGTIATASRMLWAFARENGVPLSRWLSRVDPRTTLPLWSLALTVVINLILPLINIASTAAFNALTSLTIASFYSAFLFSAAVMLYKRVTVPESDIRWGPFRLGRYLGNAVYVFAMCYSVLGVFWSFWPSTSAVTPESMNWSILVFGSVIIFSTVHWWLYARHVYTGPRVELEAPRYEHEQC